MITRLPQIALLILSATFPIWTATALAPKNPKATILCLPPGSTKPAPCGVVSAGSDIQLVAEGGSSGLPLRVRLDEVTEGKKPVIGRATISPRKLPGSGGTYVLTVPRHLCASASKGQRLQFEIQMLTSDLQNAENARYGDADSLGFFQMRC